MKRILCGILAGAVLLGLVGCGGSTPASSVQTAASASSEASASSIAKREIEIDPALAAPSTIQPAEAFAGGTGTESDPYQIATAEQLALLYENTRRLGKDETETLGSSTARYDFSAAWYVLTADIALNDTTDFDQWAEKAPEYGWQPIETFRGHFDGQGHTISGLYIYDTSEQLLDVGLFRSLSGATICNLTMTRCRVVEVGNSDDVSILVGNSLCSDLENCTVTDSQLFSSQPEFHSVNLGGLVGAFYGDITSSRLKKDAAPVPTPVIRGCSFSGSVSAQGGCTGIGGIVGVVKKGIVENCVNYGDISSADGYLGGVAAWVFEGSTITGCTNLGTVTSLGKDAYVGGITGSLSISTTEELLTRFENCVNQGAVQTETAGSLATGGLIGNVYHSGKGGTLELNSCRNEGSVTGQLYTGGLIGDLDPGHLEFTMQDCTNTGTVQGTTWVGGLVGIANEPSRKVTTCQILRCTNSGAVSAQNSAGGILGGGLLLSLVGRGGTLTIRSCRNTGTVTVQRMMAGGILGALTANDEEENIVIDKCENSGTVCSATTSGRLGGILGGSVIGYVDTERNTPACTITNTVNRGNIVYGDGAKNLASFAPSGGTVTPDENTTTDDKLATVLGGSCTGGIVAVSFRCVLDNCLNTGSTLLDSSMVPVYSTAELTTQEGTVQVFAASIYGLCSYGLQSKYKNEKFTNCSYVENAPVAVNAIYAKNTSKFVSNVQQVTPQQAETLAAQLLS